MFLLERLDLWKKKQEPRRKRKNITSWYTREKHITPLLKLLELFACALMLPATFIMIF